VDRWRANPGCRDARQGPELPSSHSTSTGKFKIGGGQLRESIEIRFQAAVAELLAALQLPAQIVSRELAAVQPISFAAASNRRVIGSMNEYVWQLGSYLTRTGDPLELSLQLNNTPMSAVGSKSSYGFPDEVARDLLMSWEH